MNLDIANLKATASNPELSDETRDGAVEQLRNIAGRAHDPRSQDARLVLAELGGSLPELPVENTENGQVAESETKKTDWPSKYNRIDDPDSEEFQIGSAELRCKIWLGEHNEKSGVPENENPDVALVCGGCYSAWKRARTVPKFWEFFNRVLTPSDKALLGFDFPKPTGA